VLADAEAYHAKAFRARKGGREDQNRAWGWVGSQFPKIPNSVSHGLRGRPLIFPSEFFGRANFEHPTPPSLTDLNPHFDDLDQHYVSTHIPASKGETIVELHERVNRALDRLITERDNDPGQPKTVLICTHAATMIAIGRVLTGRMPDDPDEDDFQCYTASLSKFVRRSMEHNGGVIGNWDCALNSETSYLSGGAERGW